MCRGKLEMLCRLGAAQASSDWLLPVLEHHYRSGQGLFPALKVWRVWRQAV